MRMGTHQSNHSKSCDTSHVSDAVIIEVADFVAQCHTDTLRETVMFAATHFDVEYVHIALLRDDRQSVRVVAGYLNGEFIEPGYVYALPGTPCEHVVSHDHKCYADHVQELFPDDHDLSDLHAEGYIGEPIDNDKGEAIGLIVLVSSKPLVSSESLVARMRILAGYISNTITANDAKKKLQLERDNLRNIMQTVDTMIVLMDREGKIIMINPKGCEVLGYEEHELDGADWFETCLPADEDPEGVKAVYQKMLGGKVSEVELYENDVVTKSGHRRTIAWHNSIVKDANGTIIGGLSAGNDVTDEKHLLQQLQAEKERYKNLMRSASDGIIVHDMHHRIIEHNDKAAQMLGYSDEEMMTLSVFDIDKNIPTGQINELAEQVRNNPMTFETVHQRKDGSEYDAAVTAVLIDLDEGPVFYTSVRDITRQKADSRKLVENEALLNTVINQFPDVLVVKDEYAKFALANEAVASLYNTTTEEMVGKEDSDFGVPEELSQFFKENVLNIMRSGETEVVYEDSRDANTGEIRHFKSIKKPFKTADGKDRILVIAQDITEVVDAQEKLQAILETTRDAYWLVDGEGKLLDVNMAVCEMLGYDRDEMLTMHISQIDATEQTEAVKARIDRIHKRGSARFEAVHRRKDGSLLDVDVSVTYIPSQNFHVAFIRDISERKRYENELAHQRGFLHTLINTIPDLIWLKDPNGVYLSCNPRFEQFFGASEEDIMGKTDYDFVDRELADFFRQHDKNAMMNDKPTINKEWITFASDGHRELLETTKTPMSDQDGNLIGVLGIGHDMTRQHEDEKRLLQSEQSFRSLFDSLQEAVYVQDEQGTFLAVNEGAAKMYGRSKEWFVGKTPLHVSAPERNDLVALVSAHERAMAGEPQSFEFWGIRADGTEFPKEVHQTKGTWFGKDVVFAVALDITERKLHEEQLEHIAHYDSLTGLPNRLLLADRLHQALAHVNRHGKMLAIAYLDLDGFKAVNDTHGHEMGDRLLVKVSRRLKEALREDDTLARLGGDEFVAILTGFEQPEASLPVIERLLEAVSDAVQINTMELNVSASIGVTFYPQSESVDADQLIRQSDQAMYEAKQSGKNRYHIFDADHDRDIRGRHESLQNISNALSEREFVLHYQPKVSLRTGEVVGVEALIRWEHPLNGLLVPAVFLPVIEHHPLTIEVGEWVLEEAMTQIERWKAKGISIPVSVNIDGLHLQQHDFVERLKAIMARHPEVKRGDLELEVLETSALEDISQVSEVIDGCREIGVNFALDDFGTGYSSLTYLKRLPADTLKIDKSFVIDMLDDPEDLAILDGVLGLASVFGRKAIAEGIETVEHGRMLLRMGCDLAQGYAIARPMSADALETWVNDWNLGREWQDIGIMERDDMSVLYAITEHRAWFNALSEFIKGRAETLPVLDIHSCQFGKWFRKFAERHPERGDQSARVDEIHEQLHAFAQQLIDERTRLSESECETRLAAIEGLKDEMISMILRQIDQD
jgi:diguanylate cyclase (GGDEF)-like protein/PAS domain S-box-containing protein